MFPFKSTLPAALWWGCLGGGFGKHFPGDSSNLILSRTLMAFLPSPPRPPFVFVQSLKNIAWGFGEGSCYCSLTPAWRVGKQGLQPGVHCLHVVSRRWCCLIHPSQVHRVRLWQQELPFRQVFKMNLLVQLSCQHTYSRAFLCCPQCNGDGSLLKTQLCLYIFSLASMPMNQSRGGEAAAAPPCAPVTWNSPPCMHVHPAFLLRPGLIPVSLQMCPWLPASIYVRKPFSNACRT